MPATPSTRRTAARRLAPWMLAAAALATGLPAHAAQTGSLAISAVVLSNTTCRFLTGPPTLAFGAIDPTSGSNATASTTVQFWCFGFPGTTYSLTANNGLHALAAGLRRMRNTAAPTEFMGYSLAITPASGNLPWLASLTATISGIVVPTQFQNARAGSYSDTVVLSLEP